MNGCIYKHKMLYLNLVYTLYMVCKCMSHIYGKIQGLLLQKKNKNGTVPSEQPKINPVTNILKSKANI